MAKQDDLIELLDNPDETLAVEYKSELDLSDPRSKADFARHVAALANHGGGHLVFGFNNDLTRAAQTEFPAVDRDAVAGIIKSYLNPPRLGPLKAMLANPDIGVTKSRIASASLP
jgi:predicted HTH transcriptional regulator